MISAEDGDHGDDRSVGMTAAVAAVSEAQSAPSLSFLDAPAVLEGVTRRYSRDPPPFESLPLDGGLDPIRRAVVAGASTADVVSSSPLPFSSSPPEGDDENRPSREDAKNEVDEAETKSLIASANTDLVPGRYEGGLRLWECSVDLCQHLASEIGRLDDDFDVDVLEDNGNDCKQALEEGGTTLELGAGHGLPGCLVLREYLKRRRRGGGGGEYRERDRL